MAQSKLDRLGLTLEELEEMFQETGETRPQCRWWKVADKLGVTTRQLSAYKAKLKAFKRRDLNVAKKVAQGRPLRHEESRMSATVKFPRDWIPMLTEGVSGEKGWLDYFYSAQRGFTADQHFITFFLAGNGTGKTRLLVYNLLAHAMGVHPHPLGRPPFKIRIVTPAYEEGVKKIVLPKFTETQTMPDGREMGSMLPQSFVRKNFDDKNRRIELGNGSFFEFLTTDQTLLQHAGAERDIIGFDEQPPQKYWSENKARLRNARGGGKMYLTMTPPYDPTGEYPWTATDLYENRPPNVGLYRAAMADNPAITQGFIDDFVSGMTPEEVQVRVYGDFPQFGRLVYRTYRDNYFNDPEEPGHRIERFEVPRHWPRWAAVDYHPSKPCFGVWLTVGENGDAYVYDEMGEGQTEDKNIPQLARIIQQKEGGQVITRRVFDPSGHQKQKGLRADWSPIGEFATNGVFGSDAQTSWDVGWSAVNSWLMATISPDAMQFIDKTGPRPALKRHPRLFIFDTCVMTRRAFKTHMWLRRGERLEPGQRGKDACDCVRYLLMEKPSYFMPGNRLHFVHDDLPPPFSHTEALYA
jgi:hypothetical protein